MSTMEKTTVTREMVLAEADRLKAAGIEPSNRKLLQALGGSMTTIAGFFREWKAQQSINAPAVADDIEVPAAAIDAAKHAASSIWQVCYAEARREIDLMKEQANQRVKEAEGDRDKVLVELSEAEAELAVAHAKFSTLEGENVVLRLGVTSAASTEAALKATANQMGRQIEAQATELQLVHAEHDQARLAHSAELARLTVDFERQLGEHVEAVRSTRAETAGVRIKLEENATALQQTIERERRVMTDLAQAQAEVTRLSAKLEESKAMAVLVESSLREQLADYRDQLVASTKQGDATAGERDALRAQASAAEETFREQLAGLREQVATLSAQHNAAICERDALRGQVSSQLGVIAGFSNARLDDSGAGTGTTSKRGAKSRKSPADKA